jgi:hypothetical protein
VQSAAVIVDQAELMARVKRILPILEEASNRAMERNPKSAKTVIASFRKMSRLAESLNGEQLSALLDVLEAGIPEEFRARLQ